MVLKGPGVDTKITITFNHEGGNPQQNPKSKNLLEWSPLYAKQISGGKQEKGHGVVHHVQEEHLHSNLLHQLSKWHNGSIHDRRQTNSV